MLGLSFVLGQRHKEHATNEPYEGGILSSGSARLRFSSQFYLIAMLFVIFDVETIFIFSWAIAFKELGWFGYFGVGRSEEHTSELQSQSNLVCRLLLEKKKK